MGQRVDVIDAQSRMEGRLGQRPVQTTAKSTKSYSMPKYLFGDNCIQRSSALFVVLLLNMLSDCRRSQKKKLKS